MCGDGTNLKVDSSVIQGIKCPFCEWRFEMELVNGIKDNEYFVKRELEEHLKRKHPEKI